MLAWMLVMDRSVLDRDILLSIALVLSSNKASGGGKGHDSSGETHLD